MFVDPGKYEYHNCEQLGHGAQGNGRAGARGERRIRHLPVVEGDHLLGMVGIRDLLGSIVERLWQTHDPAAHDTAKALFKK